MIFGYVSLSTFVEVRHCVFNGYTAISLSLFNRGQQLLVSPTFTDPLDGFEGVARSDFHQPLIDVPHPNHWNISSVRAKIKSSSWSQHAFCFAVGTF